MVLPSKAMSNGVSPTMTNDETPKYPRKSEDEKSEIGILPPALCGSELWIRFSSFFRAWVLGVIRHFPAAWFRDSCSEITAPADVAYLPVSEARSDWESLPEASPKRCDQTRERPTLSPRFASSPVDRSRAMKAHPGSLRQALPSQPGDDSAQFVPGEAALQNVPTPSFIPKVTCFNSIFNCKSGYFLD